MKEWISEGRVWWIVTPGTINHLLPLSQLADPSEIYLKQSCWSVYYIVMRLQILSGVTFKDVSHTEQWYVLIMGRIYFTRRALNRMWSLQNYIGRNRLFWPENTMQAPRLGMVCKWSLWDFFAEVLKLAFRRYEHNCILSPLNGHCWMDTLDPVFFFGIFLSGLLDTGDRPSMLFCDTDPWSMT